MTKAASLATQQPRLGGGVHSGARGRRRHPRAHSRLGRRAAMTDEVECIEEGGTEPTIVPLRHLAAALDADVRLTPGHDLGSVWFESHAA